MLRRRGDIQLRTCTSDKSNVGQLQSTYRPCHAFVFITLPPPPRHTLFPYTTLFRSRRNGERRRAPTASISKESPAITGVVEMDARSEERFSRNAETDLVCRLLLEKKK